MSPTLSRSLAAGALLVVFFVVLAVGSRIVFTVVVTTIVGLAFLEYARLVVPAPRRRLEGFCLCAVVLAPILRLLATSSAPLLLLLASSLLVVALGTVGDPRGRSTSFNSTTRPERFKLCSLLSFGIWYAYAIGLLLDIFLAPNGRALALLLCAAIWTRDVTAPVGGRLFPNGSPITGVSPTKTWEGALFAGACAASVTVLLQTTALVGVSALDATLVAVAAGFAGQLGDLLESSFKRMAGATHSSNALPSGQGGILDAFDGFAIVNPIIACWLSATR